MRVKGTLDKMAQRTPESPAMVQLRVLFALAMREMTTRYGRSAGGYIWAILEPVGTIVLLSAVFSQIARHPPLGSSFIHFFASGYLAFHIYMDVSRTVSSSVKVNRALLSFPRVTMLDTIIARFALQLLTSTMVFALIMGMLSVALETDTRPQLGLVLSAIAMAACLAVGVGAVNCVLFAFSPTWERIFTVLNRPMFLLSGIFYLYEDMPRAVQGPLWWNPLIHVTATMRQGFYPYYQPSFISPVFVYSVGLGLLALGVLLLRLLRARMMERP